MSGSEIDLDEIRGRVQRSIQRLHRMVEQACPGPHAVIQHRDAQPPWCPRCGRADDGTLIHDPLDNQSEAG